MCVYTTTWRRPTLSGSGTGGGTSVSAAAPLPVRPRPQSTDNVTMNQSKLIKLVRDYTYLYDLTDKRYCDHTLKEEAWSEIAKQLDSKGHECKRTWALLRDSYRRTVKKAKILNDNGIEEYVKKWKYEEEMSFLRPYLKDTLLKSMKTKTPKQNTSKESDTEENSCDMNVKPRSVTPDVILLQSTPSRSLLNGSNVAGSHSSSSKREHSNSNSSENPEHSRKKICRNATPQAYSSETPTSTQPQCKPRVSDIEQFFHSMITTVQSFPPRDRAIAKAKVFSVISEMEIEILSRDSRTHTEFVDSAASYEEQETDDVKDYYITSSPHMQDPIDGSEYKYSKRKMPRKGAT